MRLIDADSLMARSGWYNLVTGKSIHGVQDYEIASEPTVDAEPIRHGHWIKGNCSICGCPIPTDDRFDYINKSDVKYCYYCGAKMDEGIKDE